MCDACRTPGHCCFGLPLSGIYADTALEVLVELASAYGSAPDRGPDAAELGLPFIPLMKIGARWLFWCPNLGGDGRCADYENRPFACRDYRPGADRLCAESPERIARGANCHSRGMLAYA